jgi:hypothetical protein
VIKLQPVKTNSNDDDERRHAELLWAIRKVYGAVMLLVSAAFIGGGVCVARIDHPAAGLGLVPILAGAVTMFDAVVCLVRGPRS